MFIYLSIYLSAGPSHVYELLEGIPEPGINLQPTTKNKGTEHHQSDQIIFACYILMEKILGKNRFL